MLALEGHLRARAAERRERRWHTWHLMAVHVGKKMPPLNRFLGDVGPTRKDDAEIQSIVRQWARAVRAAA